MIYNKVLKATADFVTQELRSYVNNVARGAGFPIKRSLFVPFAGRIAYYKPTVSHLTRKVIGRI